MKAYYGDRFSPHMTKTPEGFLICHDVPIGRTGAQQYLPRELGLAGDELITVYRIENEVFKPSAVASFEGKAITDNHPPKDVTPDNFNTYMKGTVQNVHRGNNEQADKLLADLIVYDANLIAEIEAGKREISCGYDCKYLNNDDGSFYQVDIIGNHVAVVDSGRAGPTVAIKDEKPKGEYTVKKNILQRMYAKFVKDAEPDEIAEATRAMDALEDTPNTENKAQDDDPIAKLTEAVSILQAQVAALTQAKDENKIDNEVSALDELEAQLQPETTVTTDDPDESSVTVSPEQISDEDVSEPTHVIPTTTDKAITLNVIRAIKPVIASLPDKQRKKAADSLNKALRDAMQVKPTQQLKGGYAVLTKHKAKDTATNLNDKRAFGDNCRKRNPHYKAN